MFDGEHVPLATLDGMAERTLTISSLGKTFSVTGWKIGWATGPAALVAACGRRSSSSPSPAARRSSTRAPRRWRSATTSTRRCGRASRAKRDRLCAGLRAAGLEPLRPAGTYFVNATGRRRRRRVLPRAARARRRRGDPDRGLLRPPRGRPVARALRVLQARRGDRRGRGAARRAPPRASLRVRGKRFPPEMTGAAPPAPPPSVSS